MKKIIYLFLFFAFILVSCRDKYEDKNHFPIIDDLGNTFVFDHPPQRIISLAPSLTECIYYLGAEKSLAGVTDYCDYPQSVMEKPKVGGMLDPNIEIITNLNPDLIFLTTEGNSKVTYNNLTSLGYRVFVFNPKTVDDIVGVLRKINMIVKPLNGDSIIQYFSDSVNTVLIPKSSFAGFLSVNPLITFNSDTFIGDIFRRCGFKNIYGNLKPDYPVVSEEDLRIKNPDYLMFLTSGEDKLKNEINNEILRKFSSMKAIRENKVIYLDENIFSRPGPRVLDAIRILNKIKS